jgi:hypothetical protein
MSDLRFVRLNWAPGPSFSFNRSNELKVRCADEAAIRFLAFADAAFPRTCGSNPLAVQRISPKQLVERNIS